MDTMDIQSTSNGHVQWTQWTSIVSISVNTMDTITRHQVVEYDHFRGIVHWTCPMDMWMDTMDMSKLGQWIGKSACRFVNCVQWTQWTQCVHWTCPMDMWMDTMDMSNGHNGRPLCPLTIFGFCRLCPFW